MRALGAVLATNICLDGRKLSYVHLSTLRAENAIFAEKVLESVADKRGVLGAASVTNIWMDDEKLRYVVLRTLVSVSANFAENVFVFCVVY